jgi:SAM-dependent methyltransferase
MSRTFEAASERNSIRLPPLPPYELRRLVCHDDSLFELPTNGALAFPYVKDESLYRAVFDFGCGCGRIARQLLVQDPRPERYIGIDIHKGMVAWCQNNLSPLDSAFEFHHHDVWNLGLGPDNSRNSTASFPVGSHECSFVIAHSVFTHLYRSQTEFYLSEINRILTTDGIARTTWFLFDRLTFPMLFDFQVCLFINETDPSNAVIYDWQWLLQTLRTQNLRVVHTIPPAVRGHQWELYLSKRTNDDEDQFPQDHSSRLMMCGSGVESDARHPSPKGSTAVSGVSEISSFLAAESTAPAPTQPTVTQLAPAAGRHLLRFTGALGPEEFESTSLQLPWWYHSFYFDNGFSVRGDYDIGADISAYGFPESMEGLTVLDIGTGAGWFAFYFEQLGAEVVTIDARGYSDFDVYGRFSYPPVESEGRLPDKEADDGASIYFSPVSRGFWIMRDILRSSVRFRNARVYEIRPNFFDGQRFDLVFLGAILCHLRDPIGALMAARSVCRHRVIASTPVVLGETEPDVLPRQYLPYTKIDNISWWLPNEACFKHWFLAAGFTGVDVSRQVALRADVLRHENGKPANGDQILRVGSAFVP